MPVTVFNTISELNAYIALNIATNGTEAITGAKHQEVMHSVTLSLLNIVNSLPGETVNAFEDWDGGTTYTGGVEVVVKHNGSLWLFISGSDSLGTVPGTNGLVWQQINAVQLAHFRNQDQYLDQGGANEVSALALRRMLALRSAWQLPADELAPEPLGGEPIGYSYAVADGASGAFATFDGHRAELTTTGWAFTPVADGETLRLRAIPWILFRISGAWDVFDWQSAMVTPNLSAVTSSGNSTNSGITLGGAPLRHLGGVSGSYAVNSPGDVNVNYGASCWIDVTVSDDATMKVAADIPAAEFWMTVRGVTGGTLTWDSTYWQKATGVTLPTVVAGGEKYILHCISTLGKAVVVSCGEIVNP